MCLKERERVRESDSILSVLQITAHCTVKSEIYVPHHALYSEYFFDVKYALDNA